MSININYTDSAVAAVTNDPNSYYSKENVATPLKKSNTSEYAKYFTKDYSAYSPRDSGSGSDPSSSKTGTNSPLSRSATRINQEAELLATYNMERAERAFLGKGNFKKVMQIYTKEKALAFQYVSKMTEHISQIEKNFIEIKNINLTRSLQIYGLHSIGDDLVIVTNYCNQGDLESYAQKLSKEEKLPFFIQALEAVEELHSKGIIHRDIKPDNFLVHSDLNGNIKVFLSDFDCIKSEESKNNLFNVICSGPEGRGQNTSSDVWMCGLATAMFMTNTSIKKLDWYDDINEIKQLSGIMKQEKVQLIKEKKSHPTSLLNKIDNAKIKEACTKAMDPDPSKRPTLSEFISELKTIT